MLQKGAETVSTAADPQKNPLNNPLTAGGEKTYFLSGLVNRDTEFMTVSDRSIQKIGRARLNSGNVAKIFVKQALFESLARIRTQLNFRQRENDDALKAYCAMNLKEFEGINARQAWSNWRSVPRNLSGRLPNRAIKAIDLCCGTGQSTDVLAYYLHPGSEILGLEYNPDFVELAKGRDYLDENGEKVKVNFRAQSVLDPFLDTQGNPIPEGSIDLVNCCGAVGHHFDPNATRQLAEQVAQVVRTGGLATIDSGPHGTRPDEVTQIFSDAGFERVGAAKSCFADIYTQICFRKK